jgi:hypothetical protein
LRSRNVAHTGIALVASLTLRTSCALLTLGATFTDWALWTDIAALPERPLRTRFALLNLFDSRQTDIEFFDCGTHLIFSNWITSSALITAVCAPGQG